MNFKYLGIIAMLVLTVFLIGCSETANENANRNANLNANASTAPTNQNVNANANANTKRAPTRADYEKNKQSVADEAKSLGRKIGTGLDDGWLWTKTWFDLAAATDLKDSTINVDVENGVVTLSGTVDNPEQKAKAVTIAKSVEGVKSVKDLLKVTSNTNANKANTNTKKK